MQRQLRHTPAPDEAADRILDGHAFEGPHRNDGKMTTMENPDNAFELPAWIREHLQRYLETDGEDGHIYDLSAFGGGKVTTLLLGTTGRRSGKFSQLPLIYGQRGDDYVIVASKGGDPKHPAWYLNLETNPNVLIQVKGDRMSAVARVARGQERADLWRQMVALYPPYEDYQAATAREIPVVVLSPVAPRPA